MQDYSTLKKFTPIILSTAVFAGIMACSPYIIKSGEEAVILRFGKHVSTVTETGLRFKIPFVDKVYKANTEEVSRLEFGFRNTKDGETVVPDELTMLTSDENLVDIETIVQYKIKNIEQYMFNVDGPIETLRIIAESQIRRVIASHTLDEALTDNKSGIQSEIKTDLQAVCDEYGLGILITDVQLQDVQPPTEVQAAFKDVSAAKEDKETSINNANAFKNKVIPEAEGTAASLVNEAEAYAEERIKGAEGDVISFTALLEEYQKGKSITKTRLYLEMIEQVYPNIDKYIVNEESGALNLISIDNSSAQSTTSVKESN